MHIKIIGGGLGGLVAGILLRRKGFDVTIFEQKTYPFHRVCGEYVSNEVVPFLKKNGLFPQELCPAVIKRFSMSSVTGKEAFMDLDLGGFGLSRYAFDDFLVKIAKKEGVVVKEKMQVIGVEWKESHHLISLQDGTNETADLVLGAFGKRSKIDKSLDREFIKKPAGYIGVKYHIKTTYAEDLVSLHNFPGGYCGINRVEDGVFNLCYLAEKRLLKSSGSVPSMEKEFLFKNPILERIYAASTFMWEKPEVINEVSFSPKPCIENHVIMIGDAAGLITPLCGNGMAMAIHTAAGVSFLIEKHYKNNTLFRTDLEKDYAKWWKEKFDRRLRVGRATQKLFGAPYISQISVGLVRNVPPIAHLVMKNTHGNPFEAIEG
jgi:menaquinone-9 beta-reductase